MLHHHDSPVAQKGKKQTLALKMAFCVFIVNQQLEFVSKRLGKGERVEGVFRLLQSPPSLLDATKSYTLDL